MFKTTRANFFTLFALGAALIAGCGGGGGSSSSSSSSVSYTGVTTEAVVTSDNAAPLTAAAHDQTAANGITNAALGNSITQENTAGGLPISKVALLLAGMRDQFQTGPATALGASMNYTASGDCGGTATVTGTDNGTSGINYDLSGNGTYQNFCMNTEEGNVVVDGSMSVAKFGPVDDYVFELNTTYLSISFGGQTVTYSMEYKLTVSGSYVTAYFPTANYRAPDGKVYRLEAYRVDLTDDMTTVSISGKIYHPDYGYVTVSTPNALHYASCSGVYLPTSGVLRVTGAGDVFAEFRPQSCLEYLVCHTSGTICVPHDW